jgi:hypothetical protein
MTFNIKGQFFHTMHKFVGSLEIISGALCLSAGACKDFKQGMPMNAITVAVVLYDCEI